MKHICEIRGVIPAMLTCFNEHGDFDETKQRRLADFLLRKGVDGLYLTGSTGEAFLMDAEERCAVVDAVTDQINGKIPLIVHIGDIGTRKSIKLAKHAWEKGADALSSVPPFYFRFSNQEIEGYYRDLSEATPLPLIIYNIALAGSVNLEMIRKLAQLPQIKGVKYTLTAHHEIMWMKETLSPDFMVYSGCDEMALSGWAFGADGIIGSFYNVIPEIFLQMKEAFQNKNFQEAAECQRIADAMILFILKFPYFSAMKRMLAWMGVDCGRVRAPFEELSTSAEKELIQGLKTIRNNYGTHQIELLEQLPES